LFHAPVEELAERTSPTTRQPEARDAKSCVFHAGASSLDEIALYVTLKGVEFEVLDPPEPADRLRVLAARMARAADRTAVGSCGQGSGLDQQGGGRA
jgi:predicted DNA-binding transcriptional regulator YafY